MQKNIMDFEYPTYTGFISSLLAASSKQYFPYRFRIVLLLFSYCSPIVLLLFSYRSPIVLLSFSYRSPIVLLFSNGER